MPELPAEQSVVVPSTAGPQHGCRSIVHWANAPSVQVGVLVTQTPLTQDCDPEHVPHDPVPQEFGPHTRDPHEHAGLSVTHVPKLHDRVALHVPQERP